MKNDKIDHHFNEFSPVDFNIFGDTSLYQRLVSENLPAEKIAALHNHITVIKDQIQSLINQEDEQLTTVYGFLTLNEQEDYLAFLVSLDEDIKKYILIAS
ncbi:MAG: hypothetical protein HOH19_09035 [Kordiimonadaceae bacterium]|jgi:hypothetical protein|nr:hypothetical protein [Kordiimonadaceae bacterium]MBT6032707.1 hypothetical protein [Kordiimonadaceae bacterium]